jgi:predicted metal-dependent hydrolase
MAKPAASTVDQGGRLKAYRPIPAADRRTAFRAALAAYDRGDFFLTHELLEPAWMGTDDLPERELYQGLIKLAAAFVQEVRGNPRGIAKNLEGARPRLAAAHAAGTTGGIDLADLLPAIDTLLTRLADDLDTSPIDPPRLRRKTR